jgi:ADP-ribose pyrophosphatase YjhB (NUDIX family)
LLDREDRILLLKGRLPSKPEQPGAWFTVGGGIEPGETVRQAAAREIHEETALTGVELGPVVWLREGVLRIPDPMVFQESYLVARCDRAEPVRDGWTAMERQLLDDIRWWTLAELIATTERVFPPGLAGRLPPILAGEFPAEPERIPWD